jgi:hypothetical protein
MLAWAEYLFNEPITRIQNIPVEIFVKQGQEMLYDNIVAEAFHAVSSRQEWLQDKDTNLQTPLNEQETDSGLHRLLNTLVENNE